MRGSSVRMREAVEGGTKPVRSTERSEPPEVPTPKWIAETLLLSPPRRDSTSSTCEPPTPTGPERHLHEPRKGIRRDEIRGGSGRRVERHPRRQSRSDHV